MLDDLYSGINSTLEEQANAILREGRRGVTALSEKKDYLTEEQLNLRQAREVLNSNGFPDPSIRQGLYRRVYNPMANARPRRCMPDQDNKFNS
jgi:hypothetical protein